MNNELLKEAVREAQKTMGFDAIAYKYGITPPTLRRAVESDEKMQVRTEMAVEQIIKDFAGNSPDTKTPDKEQ